MTIKARFHQILEGNWDGSDRTAVVINVMMVCLIVANVVMVILESIRPVYDAYRSLFFWGEVFSVAIFALEYALRIWSCTEDATQQYSHPVMGRIRFALTPLAIIDLIAIIPFALFMVGGWDLRFLRVFRLLRLLKLSRYFPAMHMVGSVFYNQRRALLSALFVMVVMLVFASSLIYLVEREAQPDAFGSIPHAMWWGMATLTTVGYGDVIPVTPLGRFLGSFIALIGIGMFALPAAILASGFTEEIERRDFVVTWNVVATLPVFENLKAREIAQIARLLRFQTAIPGEVLFREGEVANCLYFVKSGRVDIEFPGRVFHIDDGDFFGEMALLAGSTRAANARAVSSCRLLVLDRDDFAELCDENVHIRHHFEQVAESRLSEMPRRD